MTDPIVVAGEVDAGAALRVAGLARSDYLRLPIQTLQVGSFGT